MSHFLSDQYAQHTFLADMAFDTLLSTLAALLVFVGMPFLDLVLGMDPKEPAQVRTSVAYAGDCKEGWNGESFLFSSPLGGGGGGGGGGRIGEGGGGKWGASL